MIQAIMKYTWNMSRQTTPSSLSRINGVAAAIVDLSKGNLRQQTIQKSLSTIIKDRKNNFNEIIYQPRFF